MWTIYFVLDNYLLSSAGKQTPYHTHINEISSPYVILVFWYDFNLLELLDYENFLPHIIFQSQSNESIWSQPLIKFLSQFSVTPHDYYLVSNRKVFFWKCVKVKTNTLEKSKIDVSKIQISLRIGFALLQFSFLTFTKSFAMCTNSKEYWCIYLEYKICQL